MSQPMDPELEDALRDAELIRLAQLLSTATTPEPPLDEAFRSGLRRSLMEEAWKAAEGKNAWWRRLFAPQGMAWAGSAALVVIVASVVVYTATQPSGGFSQDVLIQFPQQDATSVPVRQPIQITFNQPMDHGSTEAAVQITPATTIAFSWSGDTILYVQPTSGDLAPNTQYQVTIGPGAKTQGGQPVSAPKTLIFVTQPNASPSPTPPPSPSNNSLLKGQLKLTTAYPPSGNTYPVLWSADSTTLYFVGAGGTLDSMPAKGGDVTTLVPDGVSLPAIAPAGDQVAYVRGGKIVILTVASGGTKEISVSPAPTALAWVKDRLYWGANDGVYTVGSDGPERIALIPGPNEATAVLSIAPDGGHAVYGRANSLFLLDLASGKTVNLGGVGGGTTFQGWSPDGSRIVYNNVIADMSGRTVVSLPAADISWSARNEILLGSDTGLFAVRSDGTNLSKLADGTYNQPVWAPDSRTFAYLSAGLWVATAPAPPPEPSARDQADTVVNTFMQARLDRNAERASLSLDDNGKAAYNNGTPQLIPGADLGFKRFYIVTTEVDPSTPNTVRVVVRLVFAHGKVERSTVEETLSLRRAEATDPFLIDTVTAAPLRDAGKGPEVVAVKVSATQVDVTFDSDLVPSTISGVTLLDSQGKPVVATMTYLDRTVTFSGLQLTPGEHYRLVVQPTVQDIGDRHTASEYDLDLIGPASEPTSGGVLPTPSPSPGPTSTPSPSA